MVVRVINCVSSLVQGIRTTMIALSSASRTEYANLATTRPGHHLYSGTAFVHSVERAFIKMTTLKHHAKQAAHVVRSSGLLER